MKKKNLAMLYAILAASLYALNFPLSKILLNYIDSTMLASLLYLGAGFGLCVFGCFIKLFGSSKKTDALKKTELPYILSMVILDIFAPILLILGISTTNSASVALLNNFEIVATSLIALFIFREFVSKRLWVAIILVTIASVLLSFQDPDALQFNKGSLFVLSACLCWGFENNCTKMISNKSSAEIVIIKGIFSGFGSFIIALVLGESIPALRWILSAMVLGFVSYGLSINFYIMAQRDLGAAKTSAFYSIAPFLGVIFSFLMLNEKPDSRFYLALLIIVVSTYFMVRDSIALQHSHEHSHTHIHMHRHGDMLHCHEHSHMHTHIHVHDSHCESHLHKHDITELTDHKHVHMNLQETN